MRGLDRRLELERPEPAGLGGMGEMSLRPLRSSAATSARRPARTAAHSRRSIIAAGFTPRLAMKHQRQQAERLRLIGHQLDQRAADGDRLARQPSRLRVGEIIPAAAIGGIDRLENGMQTRRPVALLRAPRTGLPASLILVLARDSRRPMAAGLTRKADAMRIALRPSTVCSISGVCMAASIAGCAQTNSSFSRSSGNSVVVINGAGLLGGQDEVRHRLLADRRAAGHVDRASPRHCEQPGVGIVRDARRAARSSGPRERRPPGNPQRPSRRASGRRGRQAAGRRTGVPPARPPR